MNKAASIFLLLLINLSISGQSNTASEIQLGLSAGIASGWWIYTLGTGEGIDRTDNVPKISFEVVAIYKPNRLGFGGGLGYSFLTDNSMEAFEDTRAQRRKYAIADKSVRFYEYYIFTEYDVYSDSKFQLSPQLKLGSFGIDTIHPEKNNFKGKFLLELSTLCQFATSDRLIYTLRGFYQAMMISVDQPKFPGEKHRIFSLGLSFGLRYKL